LDSYRIPAELVPGTRIYAIGDIHGRADLLKSTLQKIDDHHTRLPVDRKILLFVGDYVDRGPASKQVIDLLIGCGKKHECVFLKGNHETFLTGFLEDPHVLDSWRSYGGLETLMSYGLQPSFKPDEAECEALSEEFGAAIPSEHLVFLHSLQPSYVCGGLFFVHAGVRPNVPLARQVERDLLWIREEFLEYDSPFELFVVHGHTPVRTAEVRSNRVNIDTGAFATGRLTCIAIEGSMIDAL
jgi:hypothetical protein